MHVVHPLTNGASTIYWVLAGCWGSKDEKTLSCHGGTESLVWLGHHLTTVRYSLWWRHVLNAVETWEKENLKLSEIFFPSPNSPLGKGAVEPKAGEGRVSECPYFLASWQIHISYWIHHWILLKGVFCLWGGRSVSFCHAKQPCVSGLEVSLILSWGSCLGLASSKE